MADPHPTGGTLDPMQCPSCQTELKAATRHGVHIDICPECRGVWLDRGEIENLLERASTGTTGTEVEPRRLISDLFTYTA